MRSLQGIAGSLWVLSTTALYTLLVSIPIFFTGLLSSSGRAPYGLGRFWSRLILKTHRVRVVAEGAERLQSDHSYVFISNHASHLDSLAIALCLPHTLRFIGKLSLARIPFFGWASRRIGIIYIDRSDSKSAHRTLDAAAASLTDGVSTLFYAEGTRSPDGRLQPFKKGGVMLALQTGLPIVPITVMGSHALMPKFARTIKPGTIRIVFGTPIDTRRCSVAHRDDLLARVREQIQRVLEGGAAP
jgi:1-acyl-sn-glycerol-3-phosphate acyltransferase